MGKERRRKFIVSNFQRRMLIASSVYLTMLVLVAVPLVFVPLANQVEDAGLTDTQERVMMTHMLDVRGRLLWALGVLSLLFVAHSVFVSHRAAGPMVNIRNTMLSVARGDLTVRVRLRQNDYLRDEADVANNMIASMDEGIGDMQAKFRELNKELTAATRAGTPVASATELLAKIEEIEQRLNHFATTPGAATTVTEVLQVAAQQIEEPIQ